MQLYEFDGYWESEPENFITLHINPSHIVYIYDTPDKLGHTSVALTKHPEHFIISSDQFKQPEGDA